MTKQRYRLVVDELGLGFGVGWDALDGDGVNCWLGEHMESAEMGLLEAAEDADAKVAELAVRPFAVAAKAARQGPEDFGGAWVFVTRGLAVTAKWIANGAIKCMRTDARLKSSGKGPLAEWEQMALANGWTPPKGRV